MRFSAAACAILGPCLILTGAAGRTAAAARRPNVVVILADDLGYGDLSSYGCPDIRTPVLDSLARQGVRLTRFYVNSPECTPSRAALLTGRHPQRVGGLECAIGLGNVGRYDEAEWLQRRGELGLPASEPTLGVLFQRAGYATAIFGKWHLGYDPKFSPTHHGFTEALVVLGGGTDYVSHTEPDGSRVLRHNGALVEKPGYLTDVFIDHALAWIARQHDQPYFLFLPFNAPHDPYQAPGDGPMKLPWGKGSRGTYRRMVEHMDKRIGDLVAAIDRSPTARDTIVVFFSDNGAPAVGSNRPLRGGKATMWEGGIRVPCIIRWPAAIPSGIESAQPMQSIDLAATLAACAGLAPPADRPLDGIDLRTSLTGGRPLFERTLFWRYKRGENRRKAVLEGNLKLVIENGRVALHDLAQDESERTDLAEAQPDNVRRLTAKLAAWEREVAAPRLRDFVPPRAADAVSAPAAARR